ncbi:MAG: AAA domain-containing protein, partial [Oscillospiraceae bacterium]
NYRVTDGQRLAATKLNPKEAEAIVALMQACFEQPEYEGKSFGVISLLGDEQVKGIQQEIEGKLKPQDIIGRSILCGNSANFQGDERDVIFLSLVDSGMGYGPLSMQNYGPDDTYRKRYNVAASRARDQLWVVDSLDSVNDLKPGDIRKTLIDYSLDPRAVQTIHSEIEKKADSPFEVAVATAISDRGYHLVQQWKVGSYRLDIVVVCGKKKVAIECDGERWHSGEEKIREDMERQTILERLGWTFIRIRGSEFYRDNEKTMERVITELAGFDIEPENIAECKSSDRETELLKRVKSRAASILNSEKTVQPEQDQATIAAALNPKTISPDNELPKPLEVPADIEKESESKQSVSISEAKPEPVEPMITKPTPPNSPEKNAVQPVSLPKNATSKATHTITRRQTLPGVSGLGTTRSKAAEGDDFIKELQEYGLEIIDNRAQSNIVWVLYNDGEKRCIESTISKHQCKSTLEKRGSIATHNRPAWRVTF